ncbi:MAG: GIY-YIG nuclease family protein [Candidatus Binatia bacterium]
MRLRRRKRSRSKSKRKGKGKQKVYAIGYKSGKKRNVKVGVSKNPKKRRDELQTGSPHKLKVYKTTKSMKQERARDLEKKLHHKYRRHQLEGEWLELSKRKFKKLKKGYQADRCENI